jgi:1,4-alpha-glucan branching enzyme
MAAKKRVYFRYSSSDAKKVAVVGSFSHWKEVRLLKKGKGGDWRTWMNLEPGVYEYRFLIDGQWANDPECDHRVPNEFGSENDVLRV